VTSDAGDHFIPGIGVDRSTSGGGARLGVTYYNYPVANCSSTTCQLDVSFVSSTNGGGSWSAPTQLAGPMSLSWLANTTQGRMVGDYVSTSVLPGGRAFPVIAVASAPTGSSFNENMFVPTGGLSVTGGALRAVVGPVFAPGAATRAGAGRPVAPATAR
jgi:hypothetical protein